MLFKIFTTSSPAKFATTTQAGSKPQQASPPGAPISKPSILRSILQKLRRSAVQPKNAHYHHPQAASTHPQGGNNSSGFATSSKTPYPIVPTIEPAQLTTPLSFAVTRVPYNSPLPAATSPSLPHASDLTTASSEIAEIKSTLSRLKRQKNDQIQRVHNMFHHVLVPTATAYATELDAEARARKLAEERLEKEIAGYTKGGGLRVQERERRWDAEEAKAKARHEMETVMKENKELEDQLFELQARTDYRHVEALQDALQGLELVDTSDRLRVSLPVEKCIVAFIEQLHAYTRSDSGRSWSSSWREEMTTAGSEPRRAGSTQEASDVSEGEEPGSEESGERSRAFLGAPVSPQWSNEGLTWVNSGSGNPSPRPSANSLRRMPRGRQGRRLNATRVASAFGDSSDEEDFGKVLDHRTYRVPYPGSGDGSD